MTTDETAAGDAGRIPVPAGPPVLAPVIPSKAAGRLNRVRIGQWFGLGGFLLALLLVASLAQAGTAIYQQNRARQMLTGRVDPVALMQVQLSSSMGGQDTAIRQYATSGSPAHLATYRQMAAEEARISATMRRMLARVPGSQRAVTDIERLDAAAGAWRAGYADPLAMAKRPAGGDQLFDAIRTQNVTLQRDLMALHTAFGGRLQDRVGNVFWSLLAVAVMIVLASLALALLIRRAVLRPLSELTSNVRAVAQGDFAHPLDIRGAAEFVELAAIVDGMRHRIMEEWRFTSEARRMLDEQTTELRRSNAELEQFAYVASHDLQEPLRKVASFCQMLERKYGDELDDRGRQYINFAVDGAKRMQALINDLLNFSRVGRHDRREESLAMRTVMDRALYSLSQLREETGAEVTWDELPELPGDKTQLTQLLQNVLGNAIKFHGDAAPRVHIGVRRDGAMWEFSCTDNGIGIDAKYRDRIFLIFQRLHPQDVYTGTGIGLAMCKKIVEHHGGRIWLDTESDAARESDTDQDGERPGTTIRWTLPTGETNDA
ncbi:MAG: histidine kinase [Streptosporangiaceae bacterium]|jgi:signal transduction histidine kinase|nr:histidine kinase [Streptosporangiaceae bacterium]